MHMLLLNWSGFLFLNMQQFWTSWQENTINIKRAHQIDKISLSQSNKRVEMVFYSVYFKLNWPHANGHTMKMSCFVFMNDYQSNAIIVIHTQKDQILNSNQNISFNFRNSRHHWIKPLKMSIIDRQNEEENLNLLI